MKKVGLVICLCINLFAADKFDCGSSYKEFEKKSTSTSCNENLQAVRILLTMFNNKCDSIGSDGEYELELKLADKLEKCDDKKEKK